MCDGMTTAAVCDTAIPRRCRSSWRKVCVPAHWHWVADRLHRTHEAAGREAYSLRVAGEVLANDRMSVVFSHHCNVNSLMSTKFANVNNSVAQPAWNGKASQPGIGGSGWCFCFIPPTSLVIRAVRGGRGGGLQYTSIISTACWLCLVLHVVFLDWWLGFALEKVVAYSIAILKVGQHKTHSTNWPCNHCCYLFICVLFQFFSELLVSRTCIIKDMISVIEM